MKKVLVPASVSKLVKSEITSASKVTISKDSFAKAEKAILPLFSKVIKKDLANIKNNVYYYIRQILKDMNIASSSVELLPKIQVSEKDGEVIISYFSQITITPSSDTNLECKKLAKMFNQLVDVKCSKSNGNFILHGKNEVKHNFVLN